MNNNGSAAFHEEDADEYVSCPFPDISLAEQCIRAASVVLIILLSLIGNIIVISVVRKSRKLQTVTHYFIMNMAVADILITLFNMVELLQRQISGHDRVFGGIVGEIYCRLLLFVQNVSMSCSILTITALAGERFCSIIFPLRKIIKMPVAKSIMVGIWVLSCAVSCPFLYASRLLDENGDGTAYYCVEDWDPLNSILASQVYYVVFFCLTYLLPLMVISVLYFKIGYKLRRRRVSGNVSLGHTQRHSKMTRKVVRMLVAVVVAFALCWLPQHVSLFLNYFALDSCPPEALWFGGELLGYANSAINPCIYIALHPEYRLQFKRILQNILPCFRSNANRNYSTTRRTTRTTTQLSFGDLNMMNFVCRTINRRGEGGTGVDLSVTATTGPHGAVVTRYNPIYNYNENCQ